MITTMSCDENGPPPRVEVITSVQCSTGAAECSKVACRRSRRMKMSSQLAKYMSWNGGHASWSGCSRKTTEVEILSLAIVLPKSTNK
jgi:hypothetical protein